MIPRVIDSAAPRRAGPSGPGAPRRAGSMTTVGVGALLMAALLASVIVAVTVGPADIGVRAVWQSIAAHLGWGATTLPVTEDAIVWNLRLPRALTSALVGAALALCGVVMQAVTRNPLAEPYLLGLSSGASVGAVVVLVLGWTVALPLAAFGGSLAALALTLVLAGAFGGATALSPSRVILGGVAVSAAFSAVTSIVIFWSTTGDSFREILGWLLGSIAGATWSSVAIVAVAFAVVGVPLALGANVLDAFAFGDDDARALGIDVTRARWLLLGAAALLTGAAVAVSGAIGFVGLIVPHATRLATGHRSRALLPLSALVGAILLTWADTLARTAFDPRELPVGIVTALIGAPVFAALLIRAKRLT
jgi:iron complex transport system permease protein